MRPGRESHSIQRARRAGENHPFEHYRMHAGAYLGKGFPERSGNHQSHGTICCKEQKKYVQVCLPKNNLIKGVTRMENIMIPAYPIGLKHQRFKQKAMDLLEKLNIVHKAGQKVECLSGGEHQRAGIAKALINEPAVVIADEPTAHLDTDLVMTLLDIISTLKQDGKTILLASHDPLIFESPVVDRVVNLRGGAIFE